MIRRKQTHMAWLTISVAVLVGGAFCGPAGGDVRVPRIFGDHMVLQREMPIPVWGWAAPGEKVSVTLGKGPAVTTSAGKDGAWRVTLPKQAAGGPVTLLVVVRVTAQDILVFVQAPLQPLKVAPLLGVAVRVTVLPLVN